VIPGDISRRAFLEALAAPVLMSATVGLRWRRHAALGNQGAPLLWGFHCGASSEPDETNFSRATALVDVLKHFPGTSVVRLSLQWNRLQPHRRSGVDWRTLDRLVDRTLQNGWRIILVVSDAPDWARAHGAAHPDDLSPSGPYAQFWSELVHRYGALVSALEPWNEPNNMFWLGNEGHEALQREREGPRVRSAITRAATAYAELFQLVASRSTPDVRRKLLLGSVEWNCTNPKHAMYVSELARLTPAHLVSQVQAFAIHPTTARLQNLGCNLKGIRELLDSLPGFQSLDLACTEFYSISRLRSYPQTPRLVPFERRAAAATVRTYQTMASLASSCRIRYACYFQAFGWSPTLRGNDQGLLFNIEDYAEGRGPLQWTEAAVAVREHLRARAATG
jgi:hypothetical protein